MKVVQIKYGSHLYRQELALRNTVLRKPLGLNIYDENLEEERNDWHFGILRGNTLLACVVVTPLGTGSISAKQMAVVQYLQRTGIGRKLVSEVETILSSRNIKTIHLSARMSALKFYQKQGCLISSKPFNKLDIPHIRMRKNLTIFKAN